jgi:lipoate-protein ligase A
MTTWRLITTWNASPAFNMGLDEALLESSDAAPTLRFYSWKPATLSLGYFQRVADVPAAQDARSLVRRITGGGAIHHQHELTFSIAVALDHPLYRGTTAESYERVHGAIASALRRFGVAPELRGARELASERAGTGMCFHRSSELDLVWNDRKGVGSAQRRKRGRVLHHGSIKLGTTPLEGDIATLEGVARGTTPESFAPALREAFESELGLEFEAGVPDALERARAQELGKRFVDPAFVRRR